MSGVCVCTCVCVGGGGGACPRTVQFYHKVLPINNNREKNMIASCMSLKQSLSSHRQV